jgi:DNA polymerase-3 subunit gamma/tau
MGQALYRSHRPKKLSEVIGQEHVTTALDRALKNGTISHAYLLTGPRGVGKTTIARILAHEVNGLPYEDDANHLDIIEIDAASNRRIDEIRDLRDKVHIAPTSAKYKVYIIDEVHMLTKEAFNALLKTLEEPPAHVVFILATTEVHKLPETIISRTQRYAFKPVDQPKVIAHLRAIAEAEHIDVDDEALALIAAHGEGSFRDSISLLDQVRNSGDHVTLVDVQATLGIAPTEVIDNLLAAISAHDAPNVITHLQTAHAAGHEPARMAKQLGETLRSQFVSGALYLPSDQTLLLLAKLIEVPASSDPKSNLEVALLDVALSGAPVTAPQPIAATKPKVISEEVQIKPAVQIDPHPAIARKRAAEETAKPQPAIIEVAPVTAEPVVRVDQHTEAESMPIDTSAVADDAAWPDILAAIKAKHNTLYSIIKATTPHFEPGRITLECSYAFHQKRLSETANQQVITDIILAVTGQNLQIKCVKGEVRAVADNQPPTLPPADEVVHTVQAAPTPAPAPAATNEVVQNISSIFGGAEVLES